MQALQSDRLAAFNPQSIAQRLDHHHHHHHHHHVLTATIPAHQPLNNCNINFTPLLEYPTIEPLSTLIYALPRASCMPRLVNLSNLNLHSPSSQIVGTPFANDNTRFEYPFPDIAPVETSTSGQRAPPSLSSTIMLMTPKVGSPSPPNPKLKLKITTNPPVPPTLVAKKANSHMRKWSLAATGQRRSSSGQSNSSVSTTATDASTGYNRSHPTPISPSRKSRR